MIKIAVASEGTIVAGHFGHCENFNIFEIEDGVITECEAEEAVKGYIAGTLKSTGSVCHEHAHAHECGNH